MSKLPALKPKEMIRILEKVGFSFIRQKGSHKFYLKEDLKVIIPWHNKDLKKGTLRHIIKQAGLTLEEFLEYLKE